MKNYKMIVSYDGSRYKGWQRLGKGELTIQETLEQALEKLLHYKTQIQGSGRTDAGVHANGQVVSMKVPFCLKADFLLKMNEILPEDIRVHNVEAADRNFHARYSAVAKTYKYYVDIKERPSVFTRKYVFHYPEMINVDEMKRAAMHLLGTHDFTSFTNDKNEEKDKIRNIYQIKIEECDGMITFTYYGDGFLQHMIRILTGTLLEVGKGNRRPEEIPQILEAKERARAGIMVPAKGLFLDKVDYE